MGIEELERLVAEGIRSGLRGAELLKWVDAERAKLKAEREAEYEAGKKAQEKENEMLRQQLAALEASKKRRAVEPTSGIDATTRHSKVEDTASSSVVANTAAIRTDTCVDDELPFKEHVTDRTETFSSLHRTAPEHQVRSKSGTSRGNLDHPVGKGPFQREITLSSKNLQKTVTLNCLCSV